MNKSLIASVNSLFRSVESSRKESNRILVDPWAKYFTESDFRITFIRYLRFCIPTLYRSIEELQAAHCVRHNAIDQLILYWLTKRHFRQVVILGAGFDMRAFRFDVQCPGVHWIEVDRSEGQDKKRAILNRLEKNASHVEYVSADLNEESLIAILKRTRLDFSKDTLFVAEGLVHYLSAAKLEEFMAIRKEFSGKCSFVFSYIESSMFRRATSVFVALVKWVKEIPMLHFETAVIRAITEKQGYRHFRQWTAEEQKAEFLRPEVFEYVSARSVGLSQHVAEVSVD